MQIFSAASQVVDLSRDESQVNDNQSPLSNGEFRKLFTAQVIALLGTGLATVALTLLAYDLSGANAGQVLGTALAIKMVAYVIFAPVVGGIAHRFRRKPLLITLDLVRALIVLAMPFVTEVWHIYLLIFLLNVFSAGFKPVFQSTIPDLIDDEGQYTKALSYSRVAYDLENLLSPILAGLALLVFSYTALFITNSVAFVASATLIIMVVLPAAERVDRLGGVWHEISFGIRSYLRTPRLRGMLIFYMAVSCASAMVIVNTVVYVRMQLGGSEAEVAMVLAASGAGSMLAALVMPSLLERFQDRTMMLWGCVCMSLGLISISTMPGIHVSLPVWFCIGLGWSMVQTPAGRVVNRSSSVPDRPSYFSAQFALTHACWLLAYPIAGQLGIALGIDTTAMIFSVAVLVFACLGGLAWPSHDPMVLQHSHEETRHSHGHFHDDHHRHVHEGNIPGENTQEENAQVEAHNHEHIHSRYTHSHLFVIDDHHPEWPHEK
jgi:MFS family permease